MCWSFQLPLARDLYWTCLAENPNFAPAWAWLGRCCWFLDKFTHSNSVIAELAEAAFQRAFLIDPDLSSAHQFYTVLQIDLGRSDEAMHRLLDRLERHPAEAESFSSLVQVLRFRGLLRESVAAHRRAVELDPAVTTSVAHTFFLTGQYKTASKPTVDDLDITWMRPHGLHWATESKRLPSCGNDPATLRSRSL